MRRDISHTYVHQPTSAVSNEQVTTTRRRWQPVLYHKRCFKLAETIHSMAVPDRDRAGGVHTYGVLKALRYDMNGQFPLYGKPPEKLALSVENSAGRRIFWRRDSNLYPAELPAGTPPATQTDPGTTNTSPRTPYTPFVRISSLPPSWWFHGGSGSARHLCSLRSSPLTAVKWGNLSTTSQKHRGDSLPA